MSITAIAPHYTAPSISASTGGGGRSERLKSASAELLEVMQMTPMERMRASILEEMNLSEGDLEAMDSEARAAVEKAIETQIKERFEQSMHKEMGKLFDVAA